MHNLKEIREFLHDVTPSPTLSTIAVASCPRTKEEKTIFLLIKLIINCKGIDPQDHIHLKCKYRYDIAR